MLSLACLLSILHLSVCILFHYLAGKSHEFKKLNVGQLRSCRCRTHSMTKYTSSSMILNFSLIKTSWWICSLSTGMSCHTLLMIGRKCLRGSKWKSFHTKMLPKWCTMLASLNSNVCQQERWQRNNWSCHQACIHCSWCGLHWVFRWMKSNLHVCFYLRTQLFTHTLNQMQDSFAWDCSHKWWSWEYFGRNHIQHMTLWQY